MSLRVGNHPDAAIAKVQPRAGCAPNPDIWSLLLAVYAAQVFFSIGSAMLGASQMTMGDEASAFWGAPIAPPHGAAPLGQRSDQLHPVSDRMRWRRG